MATARLTDEQVRVLVEAAVRFKRGARTGDHVSAEIDGPTAVEIGKALKAAGDRLLKAARGKDYCGIFQKDGIPAFARACGVSRARAYHFVYGETRDAGIGAAFELWRAGERDAGKIRAAYEARGAALKRTEGGRS